MIKILQTDKEYENNVKQYTKKDGILSLVLYGIIILSYCVLAILQTRFELIQENILLVGCLFNLSIIGITLFFLKLNHQTLDTIGLSKGKWKTSIIIGIVLACILFFNNCLSHLLSGSQLIPIKEIMILSIYYLFISLCEEIAFRGYMGTRIYAFVKRRWLAVLIVGILFIIMHFPYRMIAYHMTISDLTIKNLGWIIDLFITHIVFNFIYLKTNSLYGAIIPHWFSNFGNSIIL